MMQKNYGFSIIEKTDVSLQIRLESLGFAKVLFYFCIIGILAGCYGIFLFSQRLAEFKFPIIFLAYFFMGSGILILWRLCYSLYHQAFEFTHTFEKSPNGAIYHSIAKGAWKVLSRRRLPDPVDFLDFQVRDFGMFGFQIYALGAPSKENLLRGNFLVKFSNVLLQSPIIRFEFRFSTPTEAKEASRTLLFEIRSFVKKKEPSKSQKKSPLMKIGLTLEELKAGIKQGYDVNERDGIIGNPVLFYVAGTDPEIPAFEWKEPNYPVLAELIRSGADVNACNFYNERIIDYIIRMTAHTGENPSLQRLKSFLESYGYRKY